MIEGLTATALESLSAQQLTAAAPTVQQIARFEQQLQRTSATDAFARYDAPLAERAGLAGDFRSLIDFAGNLSGQFRSQLERPERHFDPQRWPELHMLEQTSRELRGLNFTTMQFQFIAAGLEITNRNAQMFVQQV